MKVALNGWFLAQPNTGSGQYTRHLLDGCLLRGIDIAVAAPASRSNLAKILWEQLRWPLQAKSAGADLLHSPYFALPLWPGRPAIVTVHDLIPLVLPAYRGSAAVRAYTLLQVAACRTATAIIVDSECSKRDVIRLLGVPPERVHTIYLGVDARFTPCAGGASPLDKPYIFYIGGLDERKNLPALIEAFREISPRHPNVVLAIAGQAASNSPLFPDLRAAADGLGQRVRFLGRVSEREKLALYRHAAAFVFPSLYEGFGLDPLEALACGCPVVSSNAASLPEVVGDAALLVNPNDVAAMARAIEEALNDPEPWRARGPKQAAKFTWQATADQTIALYEAALEQASS